jgi:hypothetical protein
MLHVGKMLSICSRSSFGQPSIFFPLISNSQSFSAIVNDAFLEPRMFECLLSRNALLRIVYKDLSKEIEQLFIERPIVGNKFLLQHISPASTSPIKPATHRKTLHRFDILPRCASRFGLGIVQLGAVEVLHGAGARSSAGLLNLLDHLGVDLSIAYCLHHGQVLKIVVRLKQGITCKEFHNDAPDAPNIAGKAPSQLENDLRSPIVPGRHNRRMILVIERGRSKVDQPNLAIQQHSPLAGRPRGSVRRRGNVPVVGEGLIGPVDQKNILRLEVSMDKVEVMKDFDPD